MNLEILIKCLADHYAWNDELANLRDLAELLRRLAEEVDGMANDQEQTS